MDKRSVACFCFPEQSLVARRTFIVRFSVMPPERVSPILNYSMRLNSIESDLFSLDVIDLEDASTCLRGLNYQLTDDDRDH